ncbi:hypothetical protein TNCV_1358281 [Trichonephila clavipes]|uniref:Uncharacterized protein n=1 Tax=Trichonephila clavipes TaxID=2585209 RepID=A0A8X6VHX3_TRICX|nr:hypothetical protein TNCV_1358281 [Trichonephila clavipes]
MLKTLYYWKNFYSNTIFLLAVQPKSKAYSFEEKKKKLVQKKETNGAMVFHASQLPSYDPRRVFLCRTHHLFRNSRLTRRCQSLYAFHQVNSPF